MLMTWSRYCVLYFLVIVNVDSIIQSIYDFYLGVGYAMMVCSFGVAIYYNIIIAWCYYFVFASMQAELPWAKCGQRWNTNSCYVKVTRCPTINSSMTLAPTTILPTGMMSNGTNSSCIPVGVKVTSPSEEYWKYVDNALRQYHTNYLSPFDLIYCHIY